MLSKDVVTFYDPTSPLSEAVKCLRTNLQFLIKDKQNDVIAITSAAPKEGKSFVIANLAVATAQVNKRTLVIDCDMRRPTIHKLFGIKCKEGLSEVLQAKERDLAEVSIYDSGVENLAILPCGSIPINPAELLETDALDNLLAMAREEFDVIYIDTPPVLSVADPIIISKKTAGIILVIMAQSTMEKAALRAYAMLKKSGANLLGTVFNRVETRAVGGYYKYYGYYYGKEKR
ncbi:CpsD/CapB family tyrosine-protein kinase [Candidatus Omnitrophota bacterium]